jgi:hypothetical protein
MTRPPFPRGLKAIVAQTAITGLACLALAATILVDDSPPPTTRVDESAGLFALASFAALLFLAAAVGLALRFGWVRWFWIVIEALFVLPWSIVFTLMGAFALRDGDPVGRWLPLSMLVLGLLWLAGFVVGTAYMAFGRGRHAFERPRA